MYTYTGNDVAKIMFFYFSFHGTKYGGLNTAKPHILEEWSTVLHRLRIVPCLFTYIFCEIPEFNMIMIPFWKAVIQ